MRQLGFNEGQNLKVDYRSLVDARGISVNATELIDADPDLIIATGPEAKDVVYICT